MNTPEPTETHRALARSIGIWIRQDGVSDEFIAGRLAELTALQADKHEKEILEVIDERDSAEAVINDLCEAVGVEPEWSSSFDFNDATKAVEEAVESLRKQAAATREITADDGFWGRTASRIKQKLRKAEKALSDERELRITQLAAISTACIQNTHNSAEERIGPDNPYWTAAYGDACAAVDREIAQRERAEAAETLVAEQHKVIELFGVLYNTPPLITDKEEWDALCGEAVNKLCEVYRKTPADMGSELVRLRKKIEAIDIAVQAVGLTAHWQDVEGLVKFYQLTLGLFPGAEKFNDIEHKISELREALEIIASGDGDARRRAEDALALLEK